MFQDACRKAGEYTLPVVISRRAVNGKCSSSIATAVIVNDEGWIVSAGHVLRLIPDLIAAEQQTRSLEAQAVEAGEGISRKQRRRIGLKPTDTDKWSAWVGLPGVTVEAVIDLEVADIAVAKLHGFDPAVIPRYPEFKDPATGFEPGVSLCRLGFPFHQIEPVYDPVRNSFDLPPGSVPLPRFPNEGMLARMANIVLFDNAGTPLPPPPFPLQMFETTSPGIRGQSGGPIFDKNGVIWGIQSSTISYELDLNTREPQYIHVGVGIHTSTIFAFFDGVGIKYAKSAY